MTLKRVPPLMIAGMPISAGELTSNIKRQVTLVNAYVEDEDWRKADTAICILADIAEVFYLWIVACRKQLVLEGKEKKAVIKEKGSRSTEAPGEVPKRGGRGSSKAPQGKQRGGSQKAGTVVASSFQGRNTTGR